MTAEALAGETGASIELEPLLAGAQLRRPARSALRFVRLRSDGAPTTRRRAARAGRLSTSARGGRGGESRRWRRETGGALAIVTHGLVCHSFALHHLLLEPPLVNPERWGNTAVTEIERPRALARAPDQLHATSRWPAGAWSTTSRRRRGRELAPRDVPGRRMTGTYAMSVGFDRSRSTRSTSSCSTPAARWSRSTSSGSSVSWRLADSSARRAGARTRGGRGSAGRLSGGRRAIGAGWRAAALRGLPGDLAPTPRCRSPTAPADVSVSLRRSRRSFDRPVRAAACGRFRWRECKEALADLRGMGLRLAVVSNSDGSAERSLLGDGTSTSSGTGDRFGDRRGGEARSGDLRPCGGGDGMPT